MKENNRSYIKKISVTLIIGSILLVGCGKASTEDIYEAVDNISSNSDESTAKAMQFEGQIDGIVSISLNDLEGNTVKDTFTEEEIKTIQQAFNESFIMDTAYIEMIAGNTMTITLENGQDVFIHSYGDDKFIIARIGEGQTYHLGCEVIGKILLGN
jgi:hypothetical protein